MLFSLAHSQFISIVFVQLLSNFLNKRLGNLGAWDESPGRGFGKETETEGKNR